MSCTVQNRRCWWWKGHRRKELVFHFFCLGVSVLCIWLGYLKKPVGYWDHSPLSVSIRRLAVGGVQQQVIPLICCCHSRLCSVNCDVLAGCWAYPALSYNDPTNENIIIHKMQLKERSVAFTHDDNDVVRRFGLGDCGDVDIYQAGRFWWKEALVVQLWKEWFGKYKEILTVCLISSGSWCQVWRRQRSLLLVTCTIISEWLAGLKLQVASSTWPMRLVK